MRFGECGAFSRRPPDAAGVCVSNRSPAIAIRGRSGIATSARRSLVPLDARHPRDRWPRQERHGRQRSASATQRRGRRRCPRGGRVTQNRIVRREGVRLPVARGPRCTPRSMRRCRGTLGEGFLVRGREGRLRERSDRAAPEPEADPSSRAFASALGRGIRRRCRPGAGPATESRSPKRRARSPKLRGRRRRRSTPRGAARTDISRGSQAPGTRSPGCLRTSEASAGWFPRWRVMAAVSASRSDMPAEARRRSARSGPAPSSWTRASRAAAGTVVAHLQDAGAAVVRKRPAVGPGAASPPPRRPGSRAPRESRAGQSSRRARGRRAGRGSRRAPRRARPDGGGGPGGPAVCGADLVVEAAHGAEARRRARRGPWAVPCRAGGRVAKLGRHAFRDRGGGGAEVEREEAVELARAHAQPARRLREAALPQGALLDQAQQRGSPCSRFHSSAACPEPPRAGSGGRRGSPRRPASSIADRKYRTFSRRAWGDGQIGPAVDAGREDGDEEPAVEAGVPSHARLVADGGTRVPSRSAYSTLRRRDSPFSDVIVGEASVPAGELAPILVAEEPWRAPSRRPGSFSSASASRPPRDRLTDEILGWLRDPRNSLEARPSRGGEPGGAKAAGLSAGHPGRVLSRIGAQILSGSALRSWRVRDQVERSRLPCRGPPCGAP